MTTGLIEVNFDGIVGPTHHYGGLGVGNLASMANEGTVSNPRAGAIQGIEKLKLVAKTADPDQVGVAVLPPQMRPNIAWLRKLGFSGSDGQVLQAAGRDAPRLLFAAWSASAMWTANAATCSPSRDCTDDRVHLTVANLSSSLHRSFEHEETYPTLSKIFADDAHFRVHPALPGGQLMRDEGAANHMRLNHPDGGVGIEIFVYGSENREPRSRFVARQSEFACRSIARLHGLYNENTFYLQQHPDAINAGAFHNDVVATSCENVLLYHERAFTNADRSLDPIATRYEELFGQPLHRIEISETNVSLDDAVKSYLFNSQLILNKSNGMTLVCPSQCADAEQVMEEIERILAKDNPITDVIFVDLRESMCNGGGPACVRLRVPLNGPQCQQIHQGVLWNDGLEAALVACIQSRYRDRITTKDLLDAQFAVECWDTASEIHQLLGLAPR